MSPYPRPIALALLLALVLGLVGRAAADDQRARWVPAWVSAQQLVEPHNLPPEPGLAGRTLRQVIQPTLAGDAIRVTFSNEYGEKPLVLRHVHVAKSEGGSRIDPSSGVRLTFGGSDSVVVLPGTVMLSDPADFTVTPFENLAVSVFVTSAPSNITGHPGSRTTSYLAPGEKVDAGSLPDAAETERWYLLGAVEVLADPEAAAIVVMGDSITDGRGSTTNENNRWPNLLARRLHDDPGTAHITVLNQGAGGGRVLRDGLGTSALGRFDRDVIAIPGVRWLIIFEGVNDLGTSSSNERGPDGTAEDLILAYQQMIARAQSHGIRVIGATIMPFAGFEAYDTPEKEAARQKVNDWIRHHDGFDGVIDFDQITRDPDAPQRLSSEVDGGDHLHPSAEGFQIMADAIDLSLFEAAGAGGARNR